MLALPSLLKRSDILLAYMKANGLAMAGDSTERTIIDQYISKRPEDYLTEIEIHVSC